MREAIVDTNIFLQIIKINKIVIILLMFINVIIISLTLYH